MKINFEPNTTNWKEEFEVTLSLEELALIYAYVQHSGSVAHDLLAMKNVGFPTEVKPNANQMFGEIQKVLKAKGAVK